MDFLRFLQTEFLHLIMKKISLIFILILFFSCNKNGQHEYGFYFWKSKLSLKDSEKNILEKSTVTNLYVRFFDVDKIGDKFQPVGVP